jgi:Glycosyl transferase family 11
MISVEARGRLGNHLFQFAFGIAASERLGTDFAVNDELLRANFTLEPWGGWWRRRVRGARYRASRRVAPFPVVKVDPAARDEPGEVLARLRDRTHYVGFFQSELYFADAASAVRRAFRPLPAHERSFAKRYGRLVRRGYVCCHVRQTDYREWPGGLALPASYYRDCLELLSPPADTPIVVVGDDPEWLASELGSDRLQVERNDEVIDLLLLANAQQSVLSNSSFAWWGGWLSRSDTRILAPRHWFGFKAGREEPHRVVPDRWEQVPVGGAPVSV